MLASLRQLYRRGSPQRKGAVMLMTTLTALSSWLVFWFGD